MSKASELFFENATPAFLSNMYTYISVLIRNLIIYFDVVSI